MILEFMWCKDFDNYFPFLVFLFLAVEQKKYEIKFFVLNVRQSKI